MTVRQAGSEGPKIDSDVSELLKNVDTQISFKTETQKTPEASSADLASSARVLKKLGHRPQTPHPNEVKGKDLKKVEATRVEISNKALAIERTLGELQQLNVNRAALSPGEFQAKQRAILDGAVRQGVVTREEADGLLKTANALNGSPQTPSAQPTSEEAQVIRDQLKNGQVYIREF